MFCARNSILVKKLTKIFQNKCGQDVLYKLYKSGFFNKKLPRHKPHLQLTKNSSHHKLFFSFFGIVGILECGTILHSIITNFVFVFLIIYVLMENLKMLFIMVMSAFTIDQSSATIQCKCQKFC